ncbi:zinc ABC transporter substrate-binding protein [Chachezhania antarctica]|uniref:zinc ABC transporter substrate-binding protein n=1 Tax=Chachezhania antarctica TaxID=2340860 RepID=UPI000EB4F544|nr:zinc ABC transporter substrate-binding protein [Chachezhania antarctica]|tara:strand:- start:3250 stop:4371 length:1122 start_codon:yes stop_codon:yes gene_type:complete
MTHQTPFPARCTPWTTARRSLAALATVCLGSGALAGPAVTTDIAPVQSLVAQVMDGVGTPALLVPQDASPHMLSLKPSQAKSLSQADLVIWVGPDLTPWLEKSLDSLAPDAVRLTLLEEDGFEPLPFREGLAGHDDHDAHDDDHAGEDHDGHDDHSDHADDGHDDHDEEAHDDHSGHGHDDHGDHGDHEDHAAEGHAGHDHGDEDPHAWLDPTVAQAWLGLIAAHLAEVDPDNAAIYTANAERAQAALTALDERLQAQLAPAQTVAFVTDHDAFQYFERHYGLDWVGSVSGGDAAAPGPRRIAELQEAMADHGVRCAFGEPQASDRLLRAATDGTGITLGTMDPIGRNLTLGPDLYPTLLTDLAGALTACAAQ